MQIAGWKRKVYLYLKQQGLRSFRNALLETGIFLNFILYYKYFSIAIY